MAKGVSYTATFMPYTLPSFAAYAPAFQAMGMVRPAFTRAMGARMMISITTAAT